MKKLLFVIGLLAIAGAFVATAHYGDRVGMPDGDMIDIMTEGDYEDLKNFRDSNGFGGPRWVTDQDSFEQWQDIHNDGRYGRGCPMWG